MEVKWGNLLSHLHIKLDFSKGNAIM